MDEEKISEAVRIRAGDSYRRLEVRGKFSLEQITDRPDAVKDVLKSELGRALASELRDDGTWAHVSVERVGWEAFDKAARLPYARHEWGAFCLAEIGYTIHLKRRAI